MSWMGSLAGSAFRNVVGKPVVGATKFTMRAVKNDPLTSGMTVLGAGAMAASAPAAMGAAMQNRATPEAMAAAAQRRTMAYRAANSGGYPNKPSGVLPMPYYKTASVPTQATESETWNQKRKRYGRDPATLVGAAGLAGMGPMALATKRIATKVAAEAETSNRRRILLPAAAGAAAATGVGLVLRHRLKGGLKVIQMPTKFLTDKTASAMPSRQAILDATSAARGHEKSASKVSPRQLMDAPGRIFAGGLALGLGLGASGAAMAGVAGGIGKAESLLHRHKEPKAFARVLAVDPSLRREPLAGAYYSVIHKASPYMASEPRVAAAAVRTMLESPDGYAAHPDFMKKILEVEERRQKTVNPALRLPQLPRGDLPELA